MGEARYDDTAIYELNKLLKSQVEALQLKFYKAVCPFCGAENVELFINDIEINDWAITCQHHDMLNRKARKMDFYGDDDIEKSVSYTKIERTIDV